ncbi:hypothetical protein LINPERPRIM_LOCUS31884 [Linum perenne]
MASLTPGTLLKLLEGKKQRSSLLQVTDIVPVDLDEKSLFPKQGFYIKVSDSSHSIYVSLPPEQDDLVLSNKMRLGQFVYVERLELGSSVPVAKGVKPVLGRRQQLIGTPEPLMGFGETGEVKEIRQISHRRSSWMKIGGDRNQICPSPIDQFSTPTKQSVSSVKKTVMRWRSICGKDGSPLLSKICVPSPSPSASKTRRSRIDLCNRDCGKIPISPCISSVKKIAGLTNTKSDDSPKSGNREAKNLFDQSGETSLPLDLPRKLSKLGKEALQQRETAQRVAHQALKEASVTESLIQSLKMFSDMTKSANPESPAACFEKFMEFHSQISQTIDKMESIQTFSPAATPKSKNVEKGKQLNPEEEFPALNELIKKRRAALYKSPNSRPQCPQRKGLVPSSPAAAATPLRRLVLEKADENKRPMLVTSVSGSDVIKLGKEIETEAGNWFLEFMEKSLDNGMRKISNTKTMNVDGDCTKEMPKSVMMKVINWLEDEEQCRRGRVVHTRAAQIARRLRIKMKNP